MKHHPTSLLVLPFLWLALAASPAQAQCYPDNLDGGPCCGLTNAQIPTVPKFTQLAQDICWQDCGIDQVTLVKGRWKPIATSINPGVVPPCGEQQMRVDILSTSNTPLWTGKLQLLYSRTWVGVDTNGLSFQVWRYLVNGDLSPYAAAGAPPCPVPPCASSFNNKVRFTGYVDYVDDCLTPPSGNPQFAWMLTHACDALDHHVGFPRSGSFHPDRSYTFVGPGNAFAAGPLQPIEGTLGSGFDNVRQRSLTSAPTTVVCSYEDPVTHALTPQQQVCFCGLPGSNQFMIADLVAQSSCGASVRTPVLGPLLPGYVSMGLGAWTNPNVYPGMQVLRWNIGGYDVMDACSGSSTHLVYYGVTTLGGYQAFEMLAGGPGNPLPPVFIDQASSQLVNGNPTMNRPFTSYNLMALNH